MTQHPSTEDIDAATPLVKSVRVPVAPTRAFEMFTSELGTWWPLATHSVGEHDAESVQLDGRLGGRIVETMAGDETTVWGTVELWDPPHLVGFTWHPGRSSDQATQVTVRFSAEGDGTRVELTHSGWENRPDADAARTRYHHGWGVVLDRYARGT